MSASTPHSVLRVDNLTSMEVAALTDDDGGLNLTDGHARLALTPQQAEIVDRLPELFREASGRSFPRIETEAQREFLNAIGQTDAPVEERRVLSCYSSTLATDIVARSLPVTSRIALLHPTFDNIADLMRTRGLDLVPVTEEQVLQQQWPEPPVDAIMITHPNNPTGFLTPRDHLASLAAHAARHDQTVIVDAAFRGQVAEAQYDTYAILNESGADWVVFEDTGKLWPMHELKIGFLAYSERFAAPIAQAFSESLLSASPVILLLVRELAKDWALGGAERARCLIEENRAIVRDTLATVDLHLADPHSRISVARVALPDEGPDSVALYQELITRGVHVLPCPPFHWAAPSEGLRLIRLSLARPSAAVTVAARALAEAYQRQAGLRQVARTTAS